MVGGGCAAALTLASVGCICMSQHWLFQKEWVATVPEWSILCEMEYNIISVTHLGLHYGVYGFCDIIYLAGRHC